MKNQLNQFKDSNQKLKARISAMTSCSKRTADDKDGTTLTDINDDTINAGDAFGGKAKKVKLTSTD